MPKGSFPLEVAFWRFSGGGLAGSGGLVNFHRQNIAGEYLVSAGVRRCPPVSAGTSLNSSRRSGDFLAAFAKFASPPETPPEFRFVEILGGVWKCYVILQIPPALAAGAGGDRRNIERPPPHFGDFWRPPPAIYEGRQLGGHRCEFAGTSPRFWRCPRKFAKLQNPAKTPPNSRQTPAKPPPAVAASF